MLIIVSLIQFFSLGGYYYNYSTRFGYKEFIYEIYSYIRTNKLNENYIKEIESIFDHYYENSSLGQGMELMFIFIRISFV